MAVVSRWFLGRLHWFAIPPGVDKGNSSALVVRGCSFVRLFCFVLCLDILNGAQFFTTLIFPLRTLFSHPRGLFNWVICFPSLFFFLDMYICLVQNCFCGSVWIWVHFSIVVKSVTGNLIGILLNQYLLLIEWPFSQC